MNIPALKPFRHLLLLFATMLFCVACGGEKPAPTPDSDAPEVIKPQFPIHIQLSGSHDYKNTMPYTNLSDIASDIRYIPLETTPDILIGGITALPQLSNDFIFIASRGVLMQFDQQGKFIRNFNKQGKGPGEFTVRNYGLDERKQWVHIFDYYDVHTFTFDGRHVKTLRKPFAEVPDLRYPDAMVCDQATGNLIFSGFQDGNLNEAYKYVVLDTSGTLLHKEPNFTQYHMQTPSRLSVLMSSPGGNSNRLYRYDSSYYYQYEYNDTIFVINEDFSCSPAYIRNLPNKVTLEERVKRLNGLLQDTDLYGKNGYSLCREDNRYLYLFHSHSISREEGVSLLSLYEKSTGTLIENIDYSTPLLNNLDGGMDVSVNAAGSDGGQEYRMLDPHQMKETLTEEHFAGRNIAYPEKAEALKQLVRSLNDDDNPVLMVITMK